MTTRVHKNRAIVLGGAVDDDKDEETMNSIYLNDMLVDNDLKMGVDLLGTLSKLIIVAGSPLRSKRRRPKSQEGAQLWILQI